MIPRLTKPGTEIVALDDLVGPDPIEGATHALRDIARGELFHLGRWEDFDCPACGEKMISLAEMDPRIYASANIISGIGGWCPQWFDIPIKLPQSLRRFECKPVDEPEVRERVHEPEPEWTY